MKTAIEIFHQHKSPKPRAGQTVNKTANKYGNKWVIIDNIKFQSTGEGNYYLELKSRMLRSDIQDFKRQVPFEFFVNGIRIGKYIADFVVLNFDGSIEVIDFKWMITANLATYQMKKALMKACYSVSIKEVGNKK